MPGQSPQRMGRRPRRRSRFGVQFAEKQNLKQIFGVRDRQLKRYFVEARRAKEETGPRLVWLLERRLDNAVYRAGLAETRPQARQMVSHRLLTVNDQTVNIASYSLKKGDVVAVKESKRKKAYFTNFQKRMQNVRPPSWIIVNPKTYSFEIVGEPTAEEAALGVDMRAVVELFAR